MKPVNGGKTSVSKAWKYNPVVIRLCTRAYRTGKVSQRYRDYKQSLKCKPVTI
jgi:hypothetical protein